MAGLLIGPSDPRMLGCAILENRESSMEFSIDRKVTIFVSFSFSADFFNIF